MLERKGRTGAQWIAMLAPPLVALALGLSGIAFGLPWQVTGRDERLVVESAVATFTGDWTPIDLRYPTLFIYAIRVALEPVAIALSATSGERDRAALLFAHLAIHPTAFYLVGRGLALAMGVAAVAGLAALGRRLIGERHGWLPATILAVTPVFAEFSRYARVDVPLTLWTVFALLCAVRFSQNGRRRDAVLTALFTGLAIATKWTGALLVPVVLYVSLDRTPTHASRRVWRTAMTAARLVLLAPVVVLVTTPHIVLNPGKTFVDASRVAGHVTSPFGESTNSGYEVYPEALAVSAFGAGFLVAAAFGFWRALRGRETSWTAPLLFGVIYLLVIFASRTAYERFLLPVLPVLALLAAYGIVELAQRLRRPVWGIALLAFLPTAPYLAVRVVAGATNADTRLEALNLIERRVPSGQSILLVGGERGTPPLVAINASPFAGLDWINPEDRLGRKRYAHAREIVIALKEASPRPSYQIDRAVGENLDSFLGSKRPAAIVMYDPETVVLPDAVASDYEPAVVFSPRWATWWRHTNAVMLRKSEYEAGRQRIDSSKTR